MEKNLDLYLKEYVELQAKEDELANKKEELKTQIITALGGQDKYENDFAKVTVSIAEGFKYVDEVAMIKVLKENGYGAYVKEKVDTSLNKLLKESTPLNESLKGLYKPTFTEKLIVKKA